MTMESYSTLVMEEIQIEAIGEILFISFVKWAKNSKMLRNAKA